MRRAPFFPADNRGFTLIEVIIVLVVISIMTLAVAPRMTNVFSTERENTAIVTGIIAKTFDDSFLNSRTNYLTIHLYEPDETFLKTDDSGMREIFSRNNGISVLRLEDGSFKDTDREILKHRDFPESFRFEEVVLSSGEILKRGSVMVPFYPEGYSDDMIIHVLVNDENRLSIRMRKYMKEPQVVPEYITFEDTDRI